MTGMIQTLPVALPGTLVDLHRIDLTALCSGRQHGVRVSACEPRWVGLERVNNIASASKWPGFPELVRMRAPMDFLRAGHPRRREFGARPALV
jgi:hypothetical protein